MLIAHEGRRPKVNPSAYVAPTAVLSGDVQVGVGGADTGVAEPEGDHGGVDDDCFLATGVTVFNGAQLGRGCEVRINATVPLR